MNAPTSLFSTTSNRDGSRSKNDGSTVRRFNIRTIVKTVVLVLLSNVLFYFLMMPSPVPAPSNPSPSHPIPEGHVRLRLNMHSGLPENAPGTLAALYNENNRYIADIILVEELNSQDLGPDVPHPYLVDVRRSELRPLIAVSGQSSLRAFPRGPHHITKAQEDSYEMVY